MVIQALNVRAALFLAQVGAHLKLSLKYKLVHGYHNEANCWSQLFRHSDNLGSREHDTEMMARE